MQPAAVRSIWDEVSILSRLLHYLCICLWLLARPANAGPADAGLRLLEQRNWKAAAGQFEQALKLTPANADLHIGLGIARWGMGDREGALASFRRATEIDPASANIALAFRDLGEADRAAAMLALLLQQRGQPDKAIVQYRELLRRGPRSSEAHNWLGVAYLQKNALGEAEAEFRQAIRLKPDYVRAYNNLGSTLAQAGDFNEGIRVLEAGLKHAPGDAQLRLNLGMALRSRGDADAALEHFRSLVREHPELHYEIGQTLRQKGDLQGAIDEFEHALERNPERRDAYYGLGLTLKQLAAGRRREEAPAHYDLGVALWQKGERAKAAAELDEALRLDPAAGKAYGFRGVISREMGDLPGARKMLQRAIALGPQVPFPYFDLGIVFLRMGKLENAVGQIEAGLNLPAPQGPVDSLVAELRRAIPGNAEGHNVLGRLLGLAGADPAQVISAFQEAIRLRPGYPEAHNNLGLVYVQTGDDAKAIAEFREAIRERPDDADAHQNLGAVLTTSDPPQAVRELETAVALQPGLLKAQYNLAIAYGASPRHGPAKEIEQLQSLIAAEPNYPRAEFILGRTLLRAGKLQEAIAHLHRAAAHEPELGEARYQLGLALTRAGRQAEGMAEIRKSREVIAASETEQAAALDLAEGKAALERGDLDQAVAKLRHVLKLRPDAPEPYYRLALALERKGEKAEAAAALRKALEVEPGHREARQALDRNTVETYIGQERFQDAEGLVRDYLKAHPDSSWAWYALGYSLYGQHKVGESINALAKSLQLDVKNADAHKVLGRDLMLIGRFDAAQTEFEQGARWNPASPEMPYNLGKLFSIQDNWPAAKQQFERAIRLDPSYVEAHDGLGFALEALGDDAAAMASYQEAIRLNEQRRGHAAAPYVNMSALLNRTGRPEAALEYARKALEVNAQSDRAMFQMAKAQEYRGELTAAADSLSRAISINPRVSSYYYVLATVSRRLGRAEESRKAMELFGNLERESNDLEKLRRDSRHE